MIETNDSKILYKEEVYNIQGAVFEVYAEMGCGFLEAVYQECLAKEFMKRQIPYASQTELQLSYKGEPLIQIYKADFVCYNKIIIELKATKVLLPEHHAQLHNYLKITGFHLGLLINFGHFPKAEIDRVILN